MQETLVPADRTSLPALHLEFWIVKQFVRSGRCITVCTFYVPQASEESEWHIYWNVNTADDTI
jgi:hypothetical protein